MSDDTSMKQCKVCKQLFPDTIEYFQIASTHGQKVYLRNQCKNCRIQMQRRRQEMQQQQNGKGGDIVIPIDNIPTRHCNLCQRDLPDTEEWFYPSILKRNEHRCKECHNKRQKKQKEKLVRVVYPDGYISARSLTIQLGLPEKRVEQDIRLGTLPATNIGTEKKTYWAISPTDVEAYTRFVSLPRSESTSNLNGHKEEERGRGRPKKIQEEEIAPPDRCNSCGTTRGNIRGDMNKVTHEKYGDLCARCHQLVITSNADVDRMRNVLHYLEKTRMTLVY